MHKTSNLDLKKASAAAAAAASLPSSSLVFFCSSLQEQIWQSGDALARLCERKTSRTHRTELSCSVPCKDNTQLVLAEVLQRLRLPVNTEPQQPRVWLLGGAAEQTGSTTVSKHPAILCTPTPPSPCRIVSRLRHPAVPAVPFWAQMSTKRDWDRCQKMSGT